METPGGSDGTGENVDEAPQQSEATFWISPTTPTRVVRRLVPGETRGSVPGHRCGRRATSTRSFVHGRAPSGIRGGFRRGSGGALGRRSAMADGSRESGRDDTAFLAGFTANVSRAHDRI